MTSYWIRSLPTLVAAAVVSGASQAADSPDIAAIRQVLATRYPEVKVTEVKPSPVPGIFEVLSDDAVVYIDRSGEYVIAGPLIATRTKANLSQQELDDRGSIQFDQLPLDKAIKTVRGSGERVLAVFADPDCPYCHNLEKELAGLGDVTIYTFLYPLTSLHPDARNDAHAIWCAKDRSLAWHDWMILDQAPVPTSDCQQDPIDDLLALGNKLKIESTPVLFLENGGRLSGTRPSAQLYALMGAAHAKRAADATTGKTQAAAKGAEHAKS